jgi:GxxExxY protein
MDTDGQRAGAAGREYPERDYPHQELTSKIIASSFAVFRTLGYGFLESVYRRALAVELQYCGVRIAQEVSYEIRYRGVSVGIYRADLVANSIVIVETKDRVLSRPDHARPTPELLVRRSPWAWLDRVLRPKGSSSPTHHPLGR